MQERRRSQFFLSRNKNALVNIVLDSKNVVKKFSRESLFLFCYNDVEMDIIQEFLKKNCDQFNLEQSNEYDFFAKSDLIMTIYNDCKGEDIEEKFDSNNGRKKRKLDSMSDQLENATINLKHVHCLMVRNDASQISNISTKFKAVLKNILDNVSHHNYKSCKTDNVASTLIPKDIIDFHGKTLRALKASGDGNCLFNSMSILLNKNEDFAKLLRLLSAVELFTNPSFYANHPEVKKAANFLKKDLEFIFPDVVSRDGQDAYYIEHEKEIAVLAEAKRVCINTSYCSLVTVMALSSVVGFPIYSLYPENNYVHRCLFNQKIQPRIPFSTRLNCAYILWSRISIEKKAGAFYIPNHFVPVIFD